MNKHTNYLFLSGFFLVVFLIAQFSDIYQPPTWFKAFILILCFTFLVTGLSNKIKNKS